MTIAIITETKIADLYAIAKAEAEAAEKRVKELREQIRATGMELVEGDVYDVQIGLSERVTLDRKLVSEFLTEEQLTKCSKTTLVETLRVKTHVPA